MADPALTLTLPCGNEAPALARAAVADLPAIDPVRDDVTLVVSELVANAVMHSDAVGEDCILLRVCREPGSLTIWVRDPGRSVAGPAPRSDGLQGRGGFGLVLVERLAEQWDSYDDDGRVVWARMAVPPPGTAAAA